MTPEQQSAMDAEIAVLTALHRRYEAAMLAAFHDRLRTLAARETCSVCDRDHWTTASEGMYVRHTCQICGLTQRFRIETFGYDSVRMPIQHDRGLAVPYVSFFYLPKDTQPALPEGWHQLDRRDGPE